MKRAITELVNRNEQLGGKGVWPASAPDLKRAEEAGFPSELLEFYRECEPAHYIEFKQRIWSINKALVENRDMIPGCALSPHGFIVFASNLFGDAYCVDKNSTTSEGQHPVVLFPHDEINEDTPFSVIRTFRLEVANSLEDFLVRFANGTLIDEPQYGGGGATP